MIVLCGKTASGKTTIQGELEKLGYKPIVTYTTRPMRDGEINGVTYHFISEEEFKDKEKEGFFFETTSYNVADGSTWYYGSPIAEMSDIKSCIITNPDGIKKIRSLKTIKPICFYLYVDHENQFIRLSQRDGNSDESRRRISADREDFKDIHNYTDFTLKNNGGVSKEKLAKIISNIYEEVAYE